MAVRFGSVWPDVESRPFLRRTRIGAARPTVFILGTAVSSFQAPHMDGKSCLHDDIDGIDLHLERHPALSRQRRGVGANHSRLRAAAISRVPRPAGPVTMALDGYSKLRRLIWRWSNARSAIAGRRHTTHVTFYGTATVAPKSARNKPNCIPTSKAWMALHPNEVELGKCQREQQRWKGEITAEERAAEQDPVQCRLQRSCGHPASLGALPR